MNTNETYQQALLSEASYADLQTAKNTDGGFNIGRIKTALMNIDGPGKGFSQAQAADFVTHWKVASHQPDTASGVDAVGDLVGAGSKVMIDDRDALVQMDYRLDAEGAHSPSRAECRL